MERHGSENPFLEFRKGMMENKDLFKTRDFNTICLFKYFDVKFEEVRTEQVGPRRIKTVYVEDTPELQELLLKYDNGEIQCNMRDLFRIIEETREFVMR